MRAPNLRRAPLGRDLGMRSVPGLAACACLLAGCVNLAPPFERPAAPVPAAWPAAAASAPAAAPTSDAAAVAASLAWREFITDERLRQVVAASLADNRDLRVAVLKIDQARALYRVQQAAELPELTGSASGSRQRTPPGTGSSAGNGSPRTSYSVELGLASYEIDFFSRVRNLSEAALANVLAVEENRRTAQISLIAEVANAWLTFAADQERLQLARDTLASQQASYELTRRARDLGGSSSLALARLQTTVESARVDVARYVSQLAQDRNALELLVGRPLDEAWLPPLRTAAAPGPEAASASLSSPSTTASVRLAEAPPAASRLLDVPAGLPSQVLLQRPDVRAAEQLLRAANADIGVARAALYPSISLTASAGTQSDSLSGLFKGSNRAWSFAPRIDLPIFDGGQRRANVEATQAQQGIAVAQYEAAVQTAFREVADVLAQRQTLAEQLDAQQALIDANRQALSLSEAVFRNGASSYLDVLDAQRSLYAAQQSLISLRLTEQSNRIGLYRALGGGWRDG